MASYRLVLAALIVAVVIVNSWGQNLSCGENEGPNEDEKCQVTCNGCRDCGPCICKTGYIRSALGGDCITEDTCHQLHMKWLHEAKYENRKDKFFNCSS